jgi:hypothetical protein
VERVQGGQVERVEVQIGEAAIDHQPPQTRIDHFDRRLHTQDTQNQTTNATLSVSPSSPQQSGKQSDWHVLLTISWISSSIFLISASSLLIGTTL